jgi:hypothetical protein
VFQVDRTEGIGRQYRQVVLSAEQLASGLTAHPAFPEPPPDAEPVPWEPIALLQAEPGQLEQRLGVQFQDSADDLDYLRLAVIDLSGGLRIGLVRHVRNPTPGTDVRILPEQLTSVEALRQNLAGAIDQIQGSALQRIMDGLGLVPHDFIWTRPRVAQISSES